MSEVSSWSATPASNNSAPPDGWPSILMLPNEVAPTAREMMAAIKRWRDRVEPTVTSGGSANAQTLTYDVAPTAYVVGDQYTFIAGFTNTSTLTINVNSLGAKTVKIGTVSVVARQVVAGQIVTVYYDGTNFQLIIPDADGKSNAINVVLAGGADPTGVADSTAAFTACLAATRNGKPANVYVPAGVYKLTDMISITAGQRLFGDGRLVSILKVGSDFNMAALGVVRMATTALGTELYDIGITMTQPDSLTRADYTQYPPAIYAVDGTRQIIDRVRISGAWDGIDAQGNTGGSYFGFLEIGAMNVGIQFKGALDFVHGGHWHFAFFGFTGTNQLAMYQEGEQTAATFGEVDGLDISSITAYYNSVQFNETPNLTTAPDMIGCLFMDGTNPQFSVTGRKVAISRMHIKALDTVSAITVGDDGIVEIGYLDLVGNSVGPNDAVVVNGSNARLLVNSGRASQSSADYSAFRVLNGEMVLNNIKFSQPSAIARTVGIVKQEGASSNLRMFGNCFAAKAGGATGAALVIASDTAGNHIAGNDFADWTRTLPTTIALGEYGPNKCSAYTAVPTVLFTANGTFNPSYSASPDQRFTEYEFLGEGLIFLHSTTSFDAGTITGASGSFQYDPGLPAAPLWSMPLTIGRLDNITFGASNMLFAEIATTGNVFFRVATSGGVISNLGTAAVPSGTTGIIIRVSGIIRYK